MEHDALHELQMDRKGKVRRPFSPMYVIGNLLIAGGLIMLLLIGGWYGYTWYSNEQFIQSGEQKGWHIEPTVVPGSESAAGIAGSAAAPTATIPPAPPPPAVSLNRGPGASQWMNALQQQPDTSPPVKLVIPSVSIDSKVVPVTWTMLPTKNGVTKSEWQVADYAVGHHAGTANPGQVGNVVLSGHVDYKGEVFKNLHNVNKGDEVVVYTEKGQYLYVVTDIVLVREEGVSDEVKAANAAYMNPTPDQTLTMITCWPYGIDTHRLIVIAKPYQSNLSAQSEFQLR